MLAPYCSCMEAQMAAAGEMLSGQLMWVHGEYEIVTGARLERLKQRHDRKHRRKETSDGGGT